MKRKKLLSTVIALLLACSTTICSAAGNASFIVDVNDGTSTMTEADLNGVDNSQLPVKVYKTVDGTQSLIFEGLLGDYDNGAWANTDFSKIGFLLIMNWENEEQYCIVPNQAEAVSEADNSLSVPKAETAVADNDIISKPTDSILSAAPQAVSGISEIAKQDVSADEMKADMQENTAGIETDSEEIINEILMYEDSEVPFPVSYTREYRDGKMYTIYNIPKLAPSVSQAYVTSDEPTQENDENGISLMSEPAVSLMSSGADGMSVTASTLYENAYNYENVLRPGSEITVRYNADNSASSAKEINVFFALYDDNGKMISINTSKSTVGANSSSSRDMKVKISANTTAVSAKVMVWGGMNSLIPYSNAITLTKDGTNYYGSSISSAFSISPGDEVTGKINTVNDIDYFKFVSGSNTVTSISKSGNADIELYNSSGSLVPLNNGSYYLTSGETYYVKVSDGYSGSPNYTFKLTQTAEAVSYIGIYTAKQLSDVRYGEKKSYRLMADIDLSEYSNWDSIDYFHGDFDGNGFTIKNLTINNQNGSSELGLFGDLYGTVKNLNLKGVNITSNADLAGSIAGYLYRGRLENCNVSEIENISGSFYSGGLVGANSGTIENCSVDNTSSNAIFDGEKIVGGFVGHNFDGIIRNCSVNGINGLKTWESASEGHAGGFAGYMFGGTLDNCKATNIHTITGNQSSGGFIGTNYKGNITNSSCDSITNIIDIDYSAGGFAGCNWSGSISNSTASKTEEIIGYTYAGGFAGDISNSTLYNCNVSNISKISCDGTNNINAAGFAGRISVSNIDNSSVSDIKLIQNGELYTAGFVGESTRTVIRNSSVSDIGSINSESAGGFAGSLANASSIENCTVKNISNIKCNKSFGGFVNLNNVGESIKNCSVTGIGTIENAALIGGFAGTNSGTIEQCVSSGFDIINDTSTAIGGFAGTVDSDSITKQCATNVNVQGRYAVGGFVAKFVGDSTIEKCFSTGNAALSQSGNNTNTNMGGFAGIVCETGSNANIKNCFSAGNVAIGTYSAGFVGYIKTRAAFSTCYTTSNNRNGFYDTMVSGKGSSVTNCYYDSTKAGNTSKPGAKTTAQLQTLSTYSGWTDFNNIWDLQTGKYPTLKSVQISNLSNTTGREYEQKTNPAYTDLTTPVINDVGIEILDFVNGVYKITLSEKNCTYDSRAEKPFFFWDTSDGTIKNEKTNSDGTVSFVFYADTGAEGNVVRIMIGFGDGLGQIDRKALVLKGKDE